MFPKFPKFRDRSRYIQNQMGLKMGFKTSNAYYFYGDIMNFNWIQRILGVHDLKNPNHSGNLADQLCNHGFTIPSHLPGHGENASVSTCQLPTSVQHVPIYVTPPVSPRASKALIQIEHVEMHHITSHLNYSEIQISTKIPLCYRFEPQPPHFPQQKTSPWRVGNGQKIGGPRHWCTRRGQIFDGHESWNIVFGGVWCFNH